MNVGDIVKVTEKKYPKYLGKNGIVKSVLEPRKINVQFLEVNINGEHLVFRASELKYLPKCSL
jgi:hypothetical protein